MLVRQKANLNHKNNELKIILQTIYPERVIFHSPGVRQQPWVKLKKNFDPEGVTFT
jgi:hypothetical protein